MANQINFDGVFTQHFDDSPEAYKLFSKMIDNLRSGGMLGEKPPPVPGEMPVRDAKPSVYSRTAQIMNFEQYFYK